MKKLFLLMLLTNMAWGMSVVPEKVVTPPMDLFDSFNKILDNGNIRIKVTTYNRDGKFIHHGSSKIISPKDYEKMATPARAVFVVDKHIDFAGTAFSIGQNLVLTNNHVLDPDFQNTSKCTGFKVRNSDGDTFKCKKVHYCNPSEDICLIEMEPKTKIKRDCFFCRGTKYEISLAEGPSLKLKMDYRPQDFAQEVTTAIGNSGGYGIHYSQGEGVVIHHGRIYFYAPITNGNSGGPLLNEENEVIGLVKKQSQNTIGDDPTKTYNLAVTANRVIELIREALQDDPETLLKFNASVIE